MKGRQVWRDKKTNCASGWEKRELETALIKGWIRKMRIDKFAKLRTSTNRSKKLLKLQNEKIPLPLANDQKYISIFSIYSVWKISLTTFFLRSYKGKNEKMMIYTRASPLRLTRYLRNFKLHSYSSHVFRIGSNLAPRRDSLKTLIPSIWDH